MHLERTAQRLTLVIDSPDEMGRLHLAIHEGYGVTAPDEYAARTGLSEASVKEFADAVWQGAKGVPVDALLSLRTERPGADAAGISQRGVTAEMHVVRDTSRMTIATESQSQMHHLALAIGEGARAVSRPEFYIRTGLSAPQVDELARAIRVAADAESGQCDVTLAPGVEEVENPPRTRSRIPYLVAKYFADDVSDRTPIDRLRRFRAEESPRAVAELASQVAEILRADLSEGELGARWRATPRAWDPASAGWTYRAWFEAILAAVAPVDGGGSTGGPPQS